MSETIHRQRLPYSASYVYIVPTNPASPANTTSPVPEQAASVSDAASPSAATASPEAESSSSSPARRRGRPPKAEVDAKLPGNRGKRGRPPGDKAIMDQYKARMLASPKSEKVLNKIMDAALDDEHKHQAVAWKIVADRILPVSMFEPDKKQGGISKIDVQISTVDGPVNVELKTAEPEEDAFDVEGTVVDADYEEVNE